MKRKASDSLDNKIREDIIHSILFLRKSGLKNDDEVFEKIRRDFKVSLTAIQELANEIKGQTE